MADPVELLAKKLTARAFPKENPDEYILSPSMGIKLSTTDGRFYRIAFPEDCDSNPECPFYNSPRQALDKIKCDKIPIAKGYVQDELPHRCMTRIEKVRCI